MNNLNEKNNQLYELLNQTSCPDFDRVLTNATIVIGIGTSGSKAVNTLFRMLEQSPSGIPEGVLFIVADVDKDGRKQDSLAEISQIAFIPMGSDGAGTNTENGRRIAENYYEDIKSAIEKAMVTLIENDGMETQFNLPAGTLQSVFLVGGSGGGAAGGGMDVFVTASHHAKRSVGLEQLKINQWRIGSQIPTHDVTRTASSDAQERIPANSADNFEASYIQMNTKRYMTEKPPVGEPFEIEMSVRTFANVEFDNVSRGHRIQTNEDLIHVMGGCLQAQIFTAAGKENSSRHIDDFILGTTGQTNRATGSPISEK